jgi:DNA-binding transcriptional MerR regulator
VTTVLARRYALRLDAFARASGLHPELAARLVRLGLLDARRDQSGELLFEPREVLRAARIQRLRQGLSLNYAAIGLVLDLLDRIDTLEAELRSGPRAQTGGHATWIRTA